MIVFRMLAVIVIVMGETICFSQAATPNSETGLHQCISRSSDEAGSSGVLNVSLTISTKAQVVKSGADVVVDILLTNTSKETCLVSEYLEFQQAEMNGFKPVVTNSDGKVLDLMPRPRSSKAASRGMMHLQPGKSVDDSLLLNKLVDLSSPGVYQVQIRRLESRTNTEVRSNVVTITVTP